MKLNLLASMATVLLFCSPIAVAQTDALVVDTGGYVGVNTADPSESIEVTAALEASFVDTPRRCRRPVPVLIIIQDAATGEVLLRERRTLTKESRIFTAILPPVGGENLRFQAGVLTVGSLTRCIAVGVSAVSSNGVRQLVPGRDYLTVGG